MDGDSTGGGGGSSDSRQLSSGKLKTVRGEISNRRRDGEVRRWGQWEGIHSFFLERERGHNGNSQTTKRERGEKQFIRVKAKAQRAKEKHNFPLSFHMQHPVEARAQTDLSHCSRLQNTANYTGVPPSRKPTPQPKASATGCTGTCLCE